MSCDLTFTLVESSVGGALIGGSAAALLLCYGRVLGFSGIAARSVGPIIKTFSSPEAWRVLILVGLISGGVVSRRFTEFPWKTIDYPEPAYALGGLIAGFGTSMGSGCTSGHGICGLGRLSPRSFCAVCTFVATAMCTSSYLIQVYEGGCPGAKSFIAPLELPSSYTNLLLGASTPVVLLLSSIAVTQRLPDSALAHGAVAFFTGLTSGIGLVLGGMLDQNKVRGFLNLFGGPWDPSLAMVMGAGATISLIAHQIALKSPKPLLAATWSYPPGCEFGTSGKGSVLDARLLIGAILFGIGWGFLGICPGPSIVGLASPLVGGDEPGPMFRFPLFVFMSLVGLLAAEACLPAEPMPKPPLM